jgi:hypothetical protein
MACAICEKRKERRFCPAVHGRICPQCCGEQREVTLDCPSECIYLQQAREHERRSGVEQLDVQFPKVEIGQQFLYEQEQLILGLSYVLAQSAHADRGIRDSDVISALTGLAKSYETLANSGLHIETPVTNLAHQAIAAKIQKMIEQYREAEHRHRGYRQLRDSDVVRALVFLLRMALSRRSARPRSRAFIDLLFQQFPEAQSAIAAPHEASGIIIP